MSDRRTLIDGLKTTTGVDPAVEKQFVYGPKPVAEPPREPPAPVMTRDRLTTRLRADYLTALKRASLERQLAGTSPHTLQEFLEEAIGVWLRANGYLP